MARDLAPGDCWLKLRRWRDGNEYLSLEGSRENVNAVFLAIVDLDCVAEVGYAG
jgi:hypothetical protein